MFAGNFDEREFAREDCSASRPKHDPPCRVAVDGHIEGYNNEREVYEPSASVGNGVENCGENCVSSKVR